MRLSMIAHLGSRGWYLGTVAAMLNGMSGLKAALNSALIQLHCNVSTNGNDLTRAVVPAHEKHDTGTIRCR